MIARQKFKPGDRVKLIPKWKRKYFLRSKEAEIFGDVVGFSRSPTDIRVKTDWRKSGESYPMHIWEKVNE